MSTVSKTTTQEKARHEGTITMPLDRHISERKNTAELQKEKAETAKALGIHFCSDLEEPWEVPMEPDPGYFETLSEAAAFVYAVLDKGLSDREEENTRLREALDRLLVVFVQRDLDTDDFDEVEIARAVLSKEKE